MGLRLPAAADDHPLAAERRMAIDRQYRQQLVDVSRRLREEPENIDLWSRRGDAAFFLGRYDIAVDNYTKMIELDPELKDSHWRRGIALYFAGKFKEAAEQFVRYHSFDDVDRENGIWRYLSQHRAEGQEAAAAGLLKYRKTDREPFPDIYRLFSGEMSPEGILKRIESAEITDTERQSRLFYAHLYIGLHHDVRGERKSARSHLRHAVANEWAPKASYGPRYMWHVGRLAWAEWKGEVRGR